MKALDREACILIALMTMLVLNYVDWGYVESQ